MMSRMSSSELIGQIPLDAVQMAAPNSDHLIILVEDHRRKTKLQIHDAPPPSDSTIDLEQEDLREQSDDQDPALEISKDLPNSDENAAETTSSSSDDGFRTPTDSDHKIPATTPCPPAPRKPKPSPKLKKLRSATVRRSLETEFSRRDFEAMFPSAGELSEPSYTLKFKRPRRD